MDNNPAAPVPSIPPASPTMPTPPAAAAAPGPASVTSTASGGASAGNTITPTVTEVKSNGMMKWIIIGVVLLVLAGVGYYYYTNYMSKPSEQPVTQAPTPKPTGDSVASLQSELDSLLITSVDADFTQLDQDVNSL